MTKEMGCYPSSVEPYLNFETGKGRNDWLANVEDRKTTIWKRDTCTSEVGTEACRLNTSCDTRLMRRNMLQSAAYKFRSLAIRTDHSKKDLLYFVG